MTRKEEEIMVDRTPYRQQKTATPVHHYFPLLSWSSCFGVAQSFVVYMVFCPPLFSPSFLVIVFWCCPVVCCLFEDQERRGKKMVDRTLKTQQKSGNTKTR
jgi:hypothetical protein